MEMAILAAVIPREYRRIPPCQIRKTKAPPPAKAHAQVTRNPRKTPRKPAAKPLKARQPTPNGRKTVPLPSSMPPQPARPRHHSQLKTHKPQPSPQACSTKAVVAGSMTPQSESTLLVRSNTAFNVRLGRLTCGPAWRWIRWLGSSDGGLGSRQRDARSTPRSQLPNSAFQKCMKSKSNLLILGQSLNIRYTMLRRRIRNGTMKNH